MLDARSLKRLVFVIVPAYPPAGCGARDGLVPLGLSSAGLPVPHQGTTCAWTSMAQVGASEFGHWQAFGFRSAVGSGWDSANLSSRSPGACQTCSGAVRSAEPDLQRAFGSWDRREPAGICRADSSGGLSVSSRLVISRTLRPPGEGAPKKFEFFISRECACCSTRSPNRLGLVIVSRYPPAGGRCP